MLFTINQVQQIKMPINEITPDAEWAEIYTG